jgi:hypothetical protein
MDESASGQTLDLVDRITRELVGEFGERVAPHEVERAVRESAQDYRETRIQTFVPILILRESRERLRRLGHPRST